MPRFVSSSIALPLYRTGVLILLLALVHSQAAWRERQKNVSAVSLKVARRFFRAADRVQLKDAEQGLYYVLDRRGDSIGCLLTTSPQTDHIIGYSGPNNILLALDRSGAIQGIELLSSGDTPEHVQRVRRQGKFWKGFVGWRPNQAPFPKIEGVSGATLTSSAIAEAIQTRLGAAVVSLRFPEPLALAEVQTVWTNAARLEPQGQRHRVFDTANRLIGYATRTSPQADNIAGYRGPTECLVCLELDGKTIHALRLRKSYDTDSYVDQLRRSSNFLSQYVGRPVDQLPGFQSGPDRIEGVSGATMTSRAVHEGVKQHFLGEGKHASTRSWRPKLRDLGLAAMTAGAIVMCFTSLRGRPWIRKGWQILVIIYVGLINHDLLSLALFGGWAQHGVALQAVPALALVLAASLLVPITSRRHLYCHHICPHGAAQQLLGGFTSRRWRVPHRIHRALEKVPGVLLAFALITVVLGWSINLSNLEPFDAWAWRTAGYLPILIALVGLFASIFVPQAYCRYGCPTGAIFSFMRSTGSAESWSKRDWASIAFIVLAISLVGIGRLPASASADFEPQSFQGHTMGSTWIVKVRDEIADPPALQRLIDDEFEWAEAMTSHWRTNTDLSEFNRARSTDPMPVPWPVLTLAKWAREISRLTDGAYDITVGPVVRLWGFGPDPRRSTPPTDDEIKTAAGSVGWKKLEILDGMLRKQDPSMEVDLSSIAKGWAIDHVSEALERRGLTNFLVEAGGELRARGRWTIAIEHPNRTCILADESLATSGTYRQNFAFRGKKFSHIVDPRTGRPVVHNTVRMSVRASDCAHADAWATALLALGAETGMPLADQLGLAAEFVTEESGGRLEVRQSVAWKEKEQSVSLRPHRATSTSANN